MPIEKLENLIISTPCEDYYMKIKDFYSLEINKNSVGIPKVFTYPCDLPKRFLDSLAYNKETCGNNGNFT